MFQRPAGGVISGERGESVSLFFANGGEKWGEERIDHAHVFMCQCMWHVRSVCKGEVGGVGARGGGDGGSAKNLQRSHAVHSCLPPTPPPSPALAVLSIRLPPLSIRTSGVACLASRHGCLLGWRRRWWWLRWSFQGRWRAIE